MQQKVACSKGAEMRVNVSESELKKIVYVDNRINGVVMRHAVPRGFKPCYMIIMREGDVKPTLAS